MAERNNARIVQLDNLHFVLRYEDEHGLTQHSAEFGSPREAEDHLAELRRADAEAAAGAG